MSSIARRGQGRGSKRREYSSGRVFSVSVPCSLHRLSPCIVGALDVPLEHPFDRARETRVTRGEKKEEEEVKTWPNSSR